MAVKDQRTGVERRGDTWGRRAQDKEVEQVLKNITANLTVVTGQLTGLSKRLGKQENVTRKHLVDCVRAREENKKALGAMHAENKASIAELRGDLIDNTNMTRETHEYLLPQLQGKKDRAELRQWGLKVLRALVSMFQDSKTAVPLWILVTFATAGTGAHFNLWAKVASFIFEHL